MSAKFPDVGADALDYEKGNLDEATKRYAVEVARRVKAHGARCISFSWAVHWSRRTWTG